MTDHRSYRTVRKYEPSRRSSVKRKSNHVRRIVTLNWKACKAVRAYLTVRPKDTDDQHLFLTKFRLGISPRSVERVVEKHLSEAGIHDASVHTLRHTFGTHSVTRGTRLKVVQEVLEHASLDTTTIYVSWPGKTWTASSKSTRYKG